MDFAARQPIVIRSGTDSWGPFSFDLEPGLPPGDALQNCTVQTTLNALETTSLLVEPGSVSLVGNAVTLRFQYPGDAYKGQHVIRIEAMCASGAKYPFIFKYVLVE